MEARTINIDEFEQINELLWQVQSTYDGTGHDELKRKIMTLTDKQFARFLSHRFKRDSKTDVGLDQVLRAGLCRFVEGLERLFSLPAEEFNELTFDQSHCGMIIYLEPRWHYPCLKKFAQYPLNKFMTTWQNANMPSYLHQKQELCAGVWLRQIVIQLKTMRPEELHDHEIVGAVAQRLMNIPGIWRYALFKNTPDPNKREIAGDFLNIFIGDYGRYGVHAYIQDIEKFRALISSSYYFQPDELAQLKSVLDQGFEFWFSCFITALMILKQFENKHEKNNTQPDGDQTNNLLSKLNKTTHLRSSNTNMRDYAFHYLSCMHSNWIARTVTGNPVMQKLRYTILKRIPIHVGIGSLWYTDACQELAEHYFMRDSDFGLIGRLQDLKKALYYIFVACVSDKNTQCYTLFKQIVSAYLTSNEDDISCTRWASLGEDLENWLEAKLLHVRKRGASVDWDEKYVTKEITQVITALTEHRANIQVQRLKAEIMALREKDKFKAVIDDTSSEKSSEVSSSDSSSSSPRFF